MLRRRENLRPLFFHTAYFGLLVLGFERGVVDWWSVPLVMLLCMTSFQGAVRTTETRFRYNGFNVLFFFFAVGPSIMRADTQYMLVMRKRHPRWFRQAVTELSILMVVQVGLLVVDWRAFLGA